VNGNVKSEQAAARSGEWAQHFSNASCFVEVSSHNLGGGHFCWGIVRLLQLRWLARRL